MEKSIVLIDAENVLRGWRDHCAAKGSDAKIDYSKLVAALSTGTNLLRAYFYDGVSSVVPGKKKAFLDAIQSQGIQLRTKVLKQRDFCCEHCAKQNSRMVQKGVDVSLATDILRHAWQQTCEICIVVSGDEDYKDAIDVAKDKGVRIWIASFKFALSAELRRSADKVIYIEDLFDKIQRQETP